MYGSKTGSEFESSGLDLQRPAIGSRDLRMYFGNPDPRPPEQMLNPKHSTI